MAIRVGINGFGRIGRQVLRAAKETGVTVAEVQQRLADELVRGLGEPEAVFREGW